MHLEASLKHFKVSQDFLFASVFVFTFWVCSVVSHLEIKKHKLGNFLMGLKSQSERFKTDSLRVGLFRDHHGLQAASAVRRLFDLHS